MAKETQKTAKAEKQTPPEKQNLSKANNLNKTQKAKPQQVNNPFVDKYLEFYDDIKILSRRYDW